MGNACLAKRDMERAIAHYEKARTLRPDHPQAGLNEALCRLLLGDFEQGLKLYEYRWKNEKLLDLHASAYDRPQWQGKESLRGKTILLEAEQGFGDTLQFCRYAELLAADGATVLLRVPEALGTLLADIKGVTRLLVDGDALPPFDFHCSLMSLPLACGTTLQTIPAPRAYVRCSEAAAARWRDMLGERRGLRIGLAWSGKPSHSNDRNRSMRLADIVRHLGGLAQLVSLQKEIRAVDRPVLEEHPEILHFEDSIRDFSDTAGLVANMDLVLSVDTSIAHLAGAMGKPLWVMLPFTPDWRWLLDRSDSPWYPTARLFRQSTARDWNGVLEAVAAELGSLAPSAASSSEQDSHHV
jgi:tetratricopeptide (TPR) repeat protein